MNRLIEHYEDVVRPDLLLKYDYKNVMEIPQISKIVIHMTYKNISVDKSHINPSHLVLELITGQKPCVVKAKKSMAPFKIRQGMPIGCKVTLRGVVMYEFLDRLVTTVFPRIRDFQGISLKGFDKQGNYSFGIKDFLAFQEIEADYDLFDAVYGMDVIIVTTSKTSSEAKSLLSGFQMPFKNKK